MRKLIIRFFILLGALVPAIASAGLPVNLTAGWNLVGNSDATSINVATSLGDSTKITSVWTWNKLAGKWVFYAPSMTASVLATYAQSMGYDVLSSIASKEGFWVNASTSVVLTNPLTPPPTPGGTPVPLLESDLQQGWNLVADAYSMTPSQLNAALSSSLNASGKAIDTVWAWDVPSEKWKFYAPSLEAQGGTVLADYISTQGYLPFSTALSAEEGFWLNVGASGRGPGVGGGTGTLTIIKDAQPNDPQDFHFSTVGAGLSAFDLDDDGTNANPLSNSITFTNLAAGIPFTVTEDAVSGWTVPSIQCLVAVPGLTSTFTDQLNRTFTVNLEAGANVTCTFINVKTTPTGTGTLTIIKDAQPNDPQDFHFTTVGAGLSAFDLDDDGTNANPLSNSITFTNLAAGIPFTVTEDAVSGWTVPSIQCLVAVPGLTSTFTDQLNRTFTVNLEAGANVTCTFINVKTGSTAFTAGGPTLQVSTQTIIPTVLQTAAAFTSTGSGNSGTATVTAGPTGVSNDGIFTLASFANPYPVFTLVGAIATLPSSIVLASGTTLPMAATSLGASAGLTFADFGMWAITNAVPSPLPTNSVFTYSPYAGGAQRTASMPNVINGKTYTGKMTGVLADTPIGGSDEVSSSAVSLLVNYANGTGTISGQITGINPQPWPAGGSTITPCSWPPGLAFCTYSLYWSSQGLPDPFAPISVNGTITGNSFTAVVTTLSVAGATTQTMTGNFYGANADEIAGTFIISVPSPGPGLILIGSFGAK